MSFFLSLFCFVFGKQLSLLQCKSNCKLRCRRLRAGRELAAFTFAGFMEVILPLCHQSLKCCD
ncbi:hypothetical protein M758_3G111400 [Ceratodon purpureus]|nr:hypothetical protein M758_3G111400 [Ceratodon purpureus]